MCVCVCVCEREREREKERESTGECIFFLQSQSFFIDIHNSLERRAVSMLEKKKIFEPSKIRPINLLLKHLLYSGFVLSS